MTRYTVFIPLVARDPVKGELLELYCELSPDTDRDEYERKRDRGLEPVIEALRPINLYKSGQGAMAVVQKLLDAGAKRRFALETCKVWYGNRPASSSIEGRSAELGIALLLLMHGGGSDVRTVIATGCLEVMPGKLDFDAQVKPVESLEQKLRLILDWKRGDDGKLSKEYTQVLIPADSALEKCSDVCVDLEAEGIKVVPVGTLREAAERLDIQLTERLSVVRRGVRAGLLAIGLISSLMIYGILHQAPSVSFEAEPEAGIPGKPFLVCTDSHGGFAGYEPIPLEGPNRLTPQVSVSGILGWRIRLGEPSTLEATVLNWLYRATGYRAYYLAVAFVGEHSGLHVLPTEEGATQLRKAPGDVWKWAQQVGEPAETGVLVFLVQQFRRFDFDTLEKRFQARFNGQDPDGKRSIDVTLASDFLAGQASGSMSYFFESVDKPNPCAAPPSLGKAP